MTPRTIAERLTDAAASTEPPAPPVRPPGASITRHPVLAYYVLTFSISWSGLLLVIITGHSGIPATVEQFKRLIPFAIPFILLGPSIAGMVMTGLVDGKAGLRELASRLLRWRVGAGWYAVALLTAPLVFAAVLLALSLTSPVFLPGVLAASDKVAFLLTGFVSALMVGVLEELGWMGFAVPRLRPRYGILSTGLIAGVLWGAWHVPGNDLWGGPTGGGNAPYPGEIPLGLFMAVNGFGLLVGQLPAFRVLMVWVYDRTGSLLVAMLMHASLAAATFVLGPVATSGVATLIYGFAVAAAMWAVVVAVAVARGGLLPRQTLRTRVA